MSRSIHEQQKAYDELQQALASRRREQELGRLLRHYSTLAERAAVRHWN